MRHMHILRAGGSVGTRILVRRIPLSDLREALRLGVHDFGAGFSHYIFAALICPLIGLCLFALTARMSAWHLIYPFTAGFALVGPFVSLGLYEFSRRRELGLDTAPRKIFAVLGSPALPAIAALGLWLAVLFLGWLLFAQVLYGRVFSGLVFDGPAEFLSAVFGTERGWVLLLYGNLAVLVFAFIVLGTTVVSFPLLLDRDVGVIAAVSVSALALIKNPRPVLTWGAIVAGLLMIGALPVLIGLIVVLPVLGHATWHLYRKLVWFEEPDQT